MQMNGDSKSCQTVIRFLYNFFQFEPQWPASIKSQAKILATRNTETLWVPFSSWALQAGTLTLWEGFRNPSHGICPLRGCYPGTPSPPSPDSIVVTTNIQPRSKLPVHLCRLYTVWIPDSGTVSWVYIKPTPPHISVRYSSNWLVVAPPHLSIVYQLGVVLPHGFVH